MSLKLGRKIGLCVTASLFLAGCGGFDGVQLNGKVFDAMGLNGDSGPKGDPKMAARQPLVVPPGLEALPPPGSGKVEQPTLAEIQDPDKKLKVSQADLERQQAEYCKKNYEEAQFRGDSSADSAAGPLGSCKPSIFNAVKKWTTGSTNADDSDDDFQSQ
ncbi:hypothetical protein [Hyphomicrobium sp. ghe19]|uniref:hypothetical protein n=1 Tax=Hyphomicrobium sp. ghe19 TaxID=2682968 RepID=UPI00136689CF|nr:hypothetical protein HYPP_03397 [Hyphomicrobium sp. ghe19]